MASLVLLIALPLLLYMVMIRPQQKKMREQKDMLGALAEGDEIMTTSGIYGFITAIDGDVMWIEIAEGVDIRIAKGAVMRRTTPAGETADDTTDDTTAAGDAVADATDDEADSGASGASTEGNDR